MTASIVTWSHDMPSLGAACVAIGVFDGVHIGHQALLRETVADAEDHAVRAVAITFDRDPDQVVSPETAAPQLLSLQDKLACIGELGIDMILVVPFTPKLAEMAPEEFVDRVLLSAMRPVTVHVGRDFHFGVRATGDLGTLQRLGLTHAFEVWPHDLVTSGGAPVSSTRIRALVAGGLVAEADALLCRKARVTGTVRSGRGEGRKLGFPTANIEPLPYAALPADGVYAGRAVLEDGVSWAAAISVGTPPTFPEARDYLEAHLIDFDGDLYEQTITLEFWKKLRDQQAYTSLSDLTEAITADVAAALDIAGFEDDTLEDGAENSDDDKTSGDDGVVEDPDALATAEAAVAGAETVGSPFDQIEGEWAALLIDIGIRGGTDACATAFMITSPLAAAGIPVAWDPVMPGEFPSGIRGSYADTYTLYVPAQQFDDARQALIDAESPYADEMSAAIGSCDTEEVEDPEALAAAEDAVRTLDRGTAHPRASLREGWIALASDMAYDKHKLGALSYALAAAGIPTDWAPFEPEEAPLLKLFALHETRFFVRIPQEDAEAGRQILAEVGERFPG